MTTQELLIKAKEAKKLLGSLTAEDVDRALLAMADCLVDGADAILAENAADIDWVRCAPGQLTSLSAVRHTKVSQVKKTKDIVNDTITFDGLSAGKYTLYYLYDGWNLSEGMVTVTVD